MKSVPLFLDVLSIAAVWHVFVRFRVSAETEFQFRFRSDTAVVVSDSAESLKTGFGRPLRHTHTHTHRERERERETTLIAKFHYTDPTGPGSPAKSAHVVEYELNSTTRIRPDPHGPNGVSPQKKSVRVRAGPVRSVSGPCSGI